MCVYTAVVNVDQHGIVFIWKPKVDMVQNFVSSLLPSYQINTKPYSIMPTYKAFNFFFRIEEHDLARTPLSRSLRR